MVAGFAAYEGVLIAADHPGIRYFVEALFRVGDVPGTTVLLVPMAYSFVMLVVVVLFAYTLSRRLGYEKGTLNSIGISFSASIIGSGAVYLALRMFGPLLPTNTFLGIFVQAASSGLCGAMIWLVVLWLMGSKELSDVVTVLKTKFMSRPLYESETHT